MNAIERYRERVRSIENTPEFLLEGVKLAFAEELCRLLEEQGVSRRQLAERLGTSRAYVTRILRTDYNLTAETMVKVALALHARVSLHLSPAEAVRTQWLDLVERAEASAQTGPEPCWPRDCGRPLMPAAVLGDRHERESAASAA
jgi:transcriptional regulator with XRE-family HTH domain